MVRRPGHVRVQPQVLLRVVADVVIVNTAFSLALAIRYIIVIGTGAEWNSPHALFGAYVHAYVMLAWLLTFICIAVFAVSGFYTHGRAYRGRFKILTITQAVTTSYLIFGCAVFFLGNRFQLPRAVILIAWLLTLMLAIGVRLWAKVWVGVVHAERHLGIHPSERQIKNVLVIGGDGYIGSALLPLLLAAGYRVRVLSLFLYGMEAIEPLLDHPKLQILNADFRQVDKVVEAMRDIDAVVHLGAIVGDPACALDPDVTIDINLMATRMIAEVAKGEGVNRFIFASSCSVYGASNEILDEQSTLNPVSLYAQSKIACERVLQQLSDDAFAPVLMRFGTIYGLSGRMRFDLVVNLLTAKAMVENEITVLGADQWRPFVHVDDAARALLKALGAPIVSVRNEVFNVGSDDQNYTIGQVAEMIREMVPGSRLVEQSTVDDPRNYRVSFDKIRRRLGFVPAWTLERGVQQVIDAIRSGRVQDYRDPRYSNARFLSEEGIARLVRRDGNWAKDLIAQSVPARLTSLEEHDPIVGVPDLSPSRSA